MIKKAFKSNKSLFIIGIGSISNFLIVLLLKKFFDKEFFNYYTLFITFVGIISSFGFLGLDQVYLRLSRIKNKKVLIHTDLFYILIFALIITPLGFSWYFLKTYQILNFWIFLISGIAINAIILGFNTKRLIKEFVLAQWIKNGYRLVFLTLVLIGLYFTIQINYFFLLLTGIIVLFGIASFFMALKNIKKEDQKTEHLAKYFFSFLFNIAVITFISYGERILIANLFGKEILAKYYYYSTIIIAPLMLLQQYVGFKELVNFKRQINKKMILNKLLIIVGVGVFCMAIIYGLLVIDNNRFFDIDFNNDKNLILLLFILALVKLSYGLFSAILGAQAKSKHIYYLNILTLVIIGLVFLSTLILPISLNFIILGLIITFLARTGFIYYAYVK